MSRLNTPTTIDAAPTATHTSLKAVEKQLGRVPNMFRVVANSPAAVIRGNIFDVLCRNGIFEHKAIGEQSIERNQVRLRMLLPLCIE